MIHCSLDAAIHLTDSSNDFPIGEEAVIVGFSSSGSTCKLFKGTVKHHLPVPGIKHPWCYVVFGDLK